MKNIRILVYTSLILALTACQKQDIEEPIENETMSESEAQAAPEVSFSVIEKDILRKNQLDVLHLLGMPDRIDYRSEPSMSKNKSLKWDYTTENNFTRLDIPPFSIQFSGATAYIVDFLGESNSTDRIDEKVFKDKVSNLSPVQVIENLGIPEKIRRTSKNTFYFYRIGIIREDMLYKGVWVNFDGTKYLGYSFLQTDKEKIGLN